MRQPTDIFIICISIIILSLFAAVSLWSGCMRHSEEWHTLNDAEEIMKSNPDSALLLINGIDKKNLAGNEEEARYALLKSIALDKTYVDTTTFSILDPAIDYYITNDNGSPDSRLRTHYYSGRIFQNRGDRPHAMLSFKKACNTGGISDSLTLAHAYVAMSVLDLISYRPTELTEHALSAAGLYQQLGNYDFMISSLTKALGGCLLNKNKNRADSIITQCDKIAKLNNSDYPEISYYRLSYSLEFGSDEDVERNLDKLTSTSDLPEWVIVEIARGYMRLNMPAIAKEYIELIDPEGPMSESSQYLLVKSDIYEACGLFHEALRSFKDYATLDDKEEMDNAIYGMTFAEEQFADEIKRLKDKEHLNYLLFIILIIILLLVAALIFMYYKRKLAKALLNNAEKDNERLKIDKQLIEKTNCNLELEKRNAVLERDRQLLINENLQKDTARLETEKRNVELERDRQALMAENQRLEIVQMEMEIDSLKNVLAKEAEITKPMEEAVKERITALNNLMAYAISDNEKHAIAYEEWKQKILNDTDAFMNSTRLVFKASNPDFITHLEEHGLTDYEINYACLYALGLKGKDVGRYIHLQRHYHISSNIRQKLGLDITSTNLGNYMRSQLR